MPKARDLASVGVDWAFVMYHCVVVMKTAFFKHFLTFIVMVPFIAGAQPDGDKEEEPTDEKLNSVYALGAFIGKSFDDIESARVFGLRFTPQVRAGNFNLPHRMEFTGGLGRDENPYMTEVGFFHNKTAGYFLVSKKTLGDSNSINDAEAKALLYKIAQGGDWKEVVGTKDSPTDIKGTFYEYVHEYKKQKLRFFAFRPRNKRALLVYSPLVSPSLGGTGPAQVLISFNNSEPIPFAPGWGDGGDVIVRVIDAPQSPELAAAIESGDEAERIKELDKLLIANRDNPSMIELSNKDFAVLAQTKKALLNFDKSNDPKLIIPAGREFVPIRSLPKDQMKAGLQDLQKRLEERANQLK